MRRCFRCCFGRRRSGGRSRWGFEGKVPYAVSREAARCYAVSVRAIVFLWCCMPHACGSDAVVVSLKPGGPSAKAWLDVSIGKGEQQRQHSTRHIKLMEMW